MSIDSPAKKALVLLADGCEELEAISILDVLHRGGVGLFYAAVGGDASRVVGSHGIEIKTSHTFSRPWPFPYDAIVLPGGMGGTERLMGNPDVLAELREADARGAVVAAVCAGPLVLDAAGVLRGRRYCCYPGIEKRIADGVYVPGVPFVRDGNLVTGTGPGTAARFAAEVLRALGGPADDVARGMLLA